jgi:hypothetical protein
MSTVLIPGNEQAAMENFQLQIFTLLTTTLHHHNELPAPEAVP